MNFSIEESFKLFQFEFENFFINFLSKYTSNKIFLIKSRNKIFHNYKKY